MSRTTAIVMIVVLGLLLIGLFLIILPSIKQYIRRMPKGIFVLLFIVIAFTIVYLVNYLVNNKTGGSPDYADGAESEKKASEQEETPIIRENCVVLRGNEIWVENAIADQKALEKYLDYRVENNILVTIVDDYSTAAAFREIKAILEKKGVRYSIENEKWLE
jgi:hypothetical protein